MKKELWFLFLCTFLLFPVPSYAAVFNVNSTADDDDSSWGDGVCATAGGVCTLRAALTESGVLAGADTINLPAATYNIASSLIIAGEVSLIGADTATTVVDAGNTNRVFAITTQSVVSVSHITIQNGNAGTSGLGGGIFISSDSDVTLSDLIIQDNSANSGSGIAASSNTQLAIIRSVIQNNTSIDSPSSIISSAGGIYLSSGTTTITDSAISNNTADLGGGFFYISNNLIIKNSTVSGNISTLPSTDNNGYGGGGFHVGSGSSANLVLINSTISGNRAINHGAGILVSNGTVSLYNTTVTDNLADSDNDGTGYGGGIIASNNVSGSRTINISNSIIAGNTSNTGNNPDCSSINASFNSSGYNIVGDNSGCAFTAGTGDQIGNGISPLNPLLGPLAYSGGPTKSHVLLSGSPAIDAGNPAGCIDNLGAAITTDQRGGMRPVDGGSGSAICDVGAVEMNPYPVADAGSDQVVIYGSLVTLSGTNSNALAGIKSYSWVQVPSATVTLNNATSDTASFTAPGSSEVLTFELAVTDNNDLTDTDTVVVTVNAIPGADAGTDQIANGGDLVTLDGSASSDSDGTISTYSWGQSAGMPVTILNGDTASPEFTAPAGSGVLTFVLTVTDNNGFSDFDTVNVIINSLPVANAGLDQTVEEGDVVILNGSGSIDSDGSISSYSWIRISGPAITLVNPDTATPEFTAASTGTLVLELTVTDNSGAASTDTVTITINSPQTNTQNNSSSGGGGCSVTSNAKFDPLMPVMLLLSSIYLWNRRKVR